MAVIYLDTNVIIAAYKPNDPMYNDSNKLFKKNHKFVVSPITLVELFAVLSRIKPYLEIRNEFKNANLNTLLAYILKDLKLEIMVRSYMIKFSVLNKKFRLPLEYYISIKLASALELKTLDLLHVAYAYIIKDEIDFFVTGDSDILKASKKVKQLTGIDVKSPKEM